MGMTDAFDYKRADFSNLGTSEDGNICIGRILHKTHISVTETGTIAKAMGMNVLAYDSHPNDKGRDIAEYVELDEIFAKSDVISLHCPLFPSTEALSIKIILPG